MLSIIPKEQITEASEAERSTSIKIHLSEENFEALEKGYVIYTTAYINESEKFSVQIYPPFSKTERRYDHYPEPEETKKQFREMNERTIKELEDNNLKRGHPVLYERKQKERIDEKDTT